MTQGTRQTRQRSRHAAATTRSGQELMRAKMELVAARERGESDALTRILAGHQEHVSVLTDFHAGLLATTGYESEPLTPVIEGIALRARERAFATVFMAPPVAGLVTVGQKVFGTLVEWRRSRKLGQVALAKQLGLGADVLSKLEHGKIRTATLPERLLHALGDALGATADMVRLTLENQAALAPALLRDRGGSQQAEEEPTLDFADAVRLSPNMSEHEKRSWVGE
ncbi:MAG TPA: helix-turn-helix transcriptional regulator [Ktedonobacterales bacterium]|jgi:transcriptional regulator with XRE-family HTH domain|nr:helix-turn-helix transcriptional regulator [Ktedonobacterales bacterium]